MGKSALEHARGNLHERGGAVLAVRRHDSRDGVSFRSTEFLNGSLEWEAERVPTLLEAAGEVGNAQSLVGSNHGFLVYVEGRSEDERHVLRVEVLQRESHVALARVQVVAGIECGSVGRAVHIDRAVQRVTIYRLRVGQFGSLLQNIYGEVCRVDFAHAYALAAHGNGEVLECNGGSVALGIGRHVVAHGRGSGSRGHVVHHGGERVAHCGGCGFVKLQRVDALRTRFGGSVVVGSSHRKGELCGGGVVVLHHLDVAALGGVADSCVLIVGGGGEVVRERGGVEAAHGSAVVGEGGELRSRLVRLLELYGVDRLAVVVGVVVVTLHGEGEHGGTLVVTALYRSAHAFLRVRKQVGVVSLRAEVVACGSFLIYRGAVVGEGGEGVVVEKLHVVHAKHIVSHVVVAIAEIVARCQDDVNHLRRVVSVVSKIGGIVSPVRGIACNGGVDFGNTFSSVCRRCSSALTTTHRKTEHLAVTILHRACGRCTHRVVSWDIGL